MHRSYLINLLLPFPWSPVTYYNYFLMGQLPLYHLLAEYIFEEAHLLTELFSSSWITAFLLLLIALVSVSDLYVTSDLFPIPGLWIHVALR